MKTQLNNFGFTRKSGILLPVSSLPSKYGIGGFGKSAYEFIDFLKETGVKCWQVLPLNPTSYGDSPYQSPSSVAGNPYFIDPERLYNERLISLGELKEQATEGKKIDYGRLFSERYPLLRSAYKKFLALGLEKEREYKSFVKKNTSWLSDYSLFMALKEHYNHAPWTLWNKEHKDVNSARMQREKFSEGLGFWQFVQYQFHRQWTSLKDYANKKGILIIGDMPIYVAHDSMEVWQSPEQFLLDENFDPTIVAGCPPDGFSPDGQLWGNPIYNWEKMKSDGFGWWCNRVKEAFRLYDILRIDHFRGFAGYYAIPYGETTAVNGSWHTAPGIRLFSKIREQYPKARIIAEDLGFITDDVRELLSATGFPGMKILQFAFYDDDSEYLPRCFKNENCVVYTGSHDSECTKSFLSSLSGDNLLRLKSECPHKKGQSRTYDLIEMALNSPAALAVIPMQDYLELTSDLGRINVPSTSEGNWCYRLSKGYNTEKLRNKINRLLTETKRRT